jgi:hypothetical protein
MRALARLVGALCIAAILSACGGGGGGAGGARSSIPATVATAVATSLPATQVQLIATNLAGQQRSDGGILYTSTQINPYFANIAATGAVHGGVDLINVQQWMQWYVAHSTAPNPWSLPGAITDYNVASNGALSSAGSADSVDSYAATFITLAAAASREGSPQLRAYVAGLHTSIELIASVIDAVTDADGLTWALPTYKEKYLMNNSEVYHGLVDLAYLRSQVYSDAAGSMRASAHALQVQASIGSEMWSASLNEFAVALDNGGNLTWPQAGKWQDGASQLFPILHGVIAPTSSFAQSAYTQFTTEFPGWPSLQKPDEYPWADIAFVALVMNDVSRATTYSNAVQQQYSPGFAYPWYCAESGWYIRILNGLIAPLTVANL